MAQNVNLLVGMPIFQTVTGRSATPSPIQLRVGIYTLRVQQTQVRGRGCLPFTRGTCVRVGSPAQPGLAPVVEAEASRINLTLPFSLTLKYIK